MSKMDEIRALREARYERTLARAAGARTRPAAAPTPAKAAPPAAAAEPTSAPVPAATPEAEGEQLCGHRNMSGRTCTREHGHTAKSHRYS